jgi:hypothetical protein
MSRATPPSTSARPAQRVHVVPAEGGWQVRRGGSSPATTVHATQDEATDAARSALRKSGGAVRVHGPDGRVHETLTLGRDAMAQIAAVEGISLPGDLERLLNDLDRAGPSSEERRRAVALQFGQKR